MPYPTCECADPQCPVCHGHCETHIAITPFRIDMEDLTGTDFCQECGEDAFDSGVFTDEEPDSEFDDDDWEDVDWGSTFEGELDDDDN